MPPKQREDSKLKGKGSTKKTPRASSSASAATKSSRRNKAKASRDSVDIDDPEDADEEEPAKINRKHQKGELLWERISGDSNKCDSFISEKHSVPLFINFVTLELVTKLPNDWEEKKAADRAAKKIENIAQYAGCLDIEISNITVAQMTKLAAVNRVEDEFGNDHGEFSTPTGQIPLSRLIELRPGLLHSYQGSLNSLYTLQCPGTSPWDMPFVRVLSNHRYEKSSNTLSVRFYVYYTRLLFEMIADSEIKNLTDCLRRDKFEVVPVKKRSLQPTLFTSAGDQPHSLDYRFSLAGLMRRIENRGYRLAEKQPDALNVQLYDFQRSTYQWMLDQENDPDGINGLFWEEWKYNQTSSLFYFPLAGEFRLSRPPKTNGGLLCEEMGLGKTVEIIALILGNPLKDASAVSESANPMDLPIGKGTLIVVPPTLLGQWFDEFRSKVKDINTERNPLKVARFDGYHNNTLTTVKLSQVRRLESEESPVPSPWGCEYDGSPLNLRKGEVVGVKLQHTLGDVSILGEFRGSTNNPDEVTVKFFNLAEDICQVDVILTSYDSLRKDLPQYKKLHWHRIVLDECQEIKQSTSAIATGCAGLSSSYRWMVSGTPLCTKIEDLHGELNFLKIWPFSLSDTKDGFWGAKIGKPYANGLESGLRLLHVLMDSVMMRHSKTQRYIDTNKRLVSMPERTIEWKGFSINNNYSGYGGQSEYYLIKYLERFAADAFCHFIRFGGGQQGINHGQLRHFVSWISMAITNIGDIPLAKLDYFQRVMRPVMPRLFGETVANGSASDIIVMSPQDALAHLQSQSRGNNQGFVQQSNRNLANVGFAQMEMELRDEYEAMSIRQLKDLLIENDLPIPTNWQVLPILVDLAQKSNVVTCYKKTNETINEEDNLSAFVSIGDELKVKCNTEHEALVIEAIMMNEDDTYGQLKVNYRWYLDPIKKAEVTKKLESARKKPYVDLLVTKGMQDKKKQQGSSSSVAVHETVHEQGFSTLYKIMAGQDVDCPICMMPLTQPTFTPCVHAYCKPCIEGLINSNRASVSKCAVCRAKIEFKNLVEVDISLAEGDDKAEGAAATDAGDNAAVEVLDIDADYSDDDVNSNIRAKRMKVNETHGVSVGSSSAFAVYGGEGSSSSASASASVTDQGTVFTIPDFNSQSVAPSQEQVDNMRVHGSFSNNDRSIAFPSLPPQFLHAHHSLTKSRASVPHRQEHYGGYQFFMNGVFGYPFGQSFNDPFTSSSFGGHSSSQSNGDIEYFSSRFMAVLEDMKTVLRDDPFAKFVMFSQHSSTLTAFKKMFTALNNRQDRHRLLVDESTQTQINTQFHCAVIDGHGSRKTEEELDRFRNNPECNVCLLTTGVAATGLTLTMAYTCYILEPAYNAAEESQALSRVHRIGQSHRSVRCVIFYGMDTAEERLLALRKANGTISSHFTADNSEGSNQDEEEIGARQGRDNRRRPRNSTTNDGEGGRSSNTNAAKSLFTTEQLQCIFGVTNERIAQYRQHHW